MAVFLKDAVDGRVLLTAEGKVATGEDCCCVSDDECPCRDDLPSSLVMTIWPSEPDFTFTITMTLQAAGYPGAPCYYEGTGTDVNDIEWNGGIEYVASQGSWEAGAIALDAEGDVSGSRDPADCDDPTGSYGADITVT